MTRGCLPSAAGTLMAFAAVYAMVYGLTARTYWAASGKPLNA